jgi:hypothetical protein
MIIAHTMIPAHTTMRPMRKRETTKRTPRKQQIEYTAGCIRLPSPSEGEEAARRRK